MNKNNKKAKKKNEDFKKFFGNKKEGQGFADKTKKKAAYEYLKLLKKEKRQQIGEGKTPQQHRPLAFITSPRKNGRGKISHTFSAAQKVAKKKQEEREKQKETVQKATQEKQAAMKAYKERKREQHLKLCKRTSKGQPVMRHQMEVLLQKLQKQRGESSGSKS